ncbi:MAG TPA: DUF6691 family protein [Alphaproteobacteria bacterium]|nr:DUF6691 family protein [Alphaproteobacteria bacterium]
MTTRHLAALLAGLLFGAGLAVSQMIDPAKVLGFLDIAGDWDPSLILVMVGALIVAAPAFWIADRRIRPVCGERFDIPARRDIDKRLVLGAIVFGIGWGLAGYCPGPAIAGLTLGLWQTWLFVAAMLAGMVLHRFALNR